MPHAAGPAIAESHAARPWVGQSIPRVEDAALLTGRGRFIDDLGVRPGTLYAAILRSPHAHAEILSIDLAAALRADGVVAVLTGDDIKALTTSLVVGVKAPIECWPIAVGRVRYVGESVAVVVASDRYKAEDAVDLIDVQYRALAANIDPLRALSPNSPVIHDGFGGNVASDRTFRYGDPERAFAEAAHRISIDIRYPRNSCTPIETYGVVADYNASEDAFDILANFQGPFSIHAVISRALKVPGNRVPTSCCWLRHRARSGVRSSGSRIVSSTSRLRYRRPTVRPRSRPRSHPTAGSRHSTGIRWKIAAPICARRSPPRFTACTAT